MKTLKLTLKKQYFDLIEKGIKTEEYRQIKPYWFSRLLYKIQYPRGGYFNASPDILKKDFKCKGGEEFTGGGPIFENFHLVEFTNDYNKLSPKITLECQNIIIGEGLEEWGAVKGENYFIIKLGREVGRQNHR